MSVEVLSATTDGRRWAECVRRCLGDRSDIFFSSAYHLVNESYERGTAEAFVFTEQDELFFFPAIRRAIESTPFSDLTTPYGYGGPIATTDDPEFIRRAVASFEQTCAASGIVSAFVRFHPIIDNVRILEGSFAVERNRTVASVDLTKDLDLLYSEMGGNARGAIKQARRFGLEVEIDETGESIEEFVDLYYLTMDALRASSNYYFKRSFFRAMAGSLAGNLLIFNVHHKGRLILSNLNLVAGGTMHYHLSASDRNFLNLRPSNLAIWEMMKWAKEHGCAHLHLGGGNEDSPDDPLFRFKASFTKLTKPFYIGKKIIDERRFSELETSWEKRTPNARLVPAAFFTKYRLTEREIEEKFTDNRIIGIGIGGHSLGILEILKSRGAYRIAGLVDRKAELVGKTFMGVRVLGGDDILESLRQTGVGSAYVGVGGVGDNDKRRFVYERLRSLGFKLPVIAHQTAIVAKSAQLGDGTVLLAGAIVNANARVGVNVILNTGAIVEHNNVIGDHCHISPGVRLGGDVVVGDGSHIGIGATVLQGVRIGAGAIVGAGAVVTEDLPDGVVAVGVPAKVIRKRSLDL